MDDKNWVDLDDESLESIVLDFRFAEIQHELYALEQHRLATEAQLASILETSRERLREVVTDDDEDIVTDQLRWVDNFIDDEMPRFFRYPILVSLWAIFEAAARDISEDIRKRSGQRLTIDDLKGRDTLDQTKKYFEQVVRFPLVASDESLRYLRMLLTLRNAIAHGNGRKDAIRESTWHKIESWNEAGIGTEYGFLTFTADFIERMVQVVSDSLKELIERAKVDSN
jgi:hypothetical protein